MPNFAVTAPREPAGSPDPVVVTLAASAGAADIEDACAALRAQLRAGSTGPAVVCDVAALGRSDLGTVDLICRLAATARLAGRRLVLRGVPWHLRSLLLFAGLGDTLPCLDDEASPSVEPER